MEYKHVCTCTCTCSSAYNRGGVVNDRNAMHGVFLSMRIKIFQQTHGVPVSAMYMYM